MRRTLLISTLCLISTVHGTNNTLHYLAPETHAQLTSPVFDLWEWLWRNRPIVRTKRVNAMGQGNM